MTVEDAILTLAAERGAQKSLCPSEAARRLAPEDWRSRMKEVRAAAIELAKQGRIHILRKGKPVDPDHFKGVYRLQIRNDTP